MLRSQTGLGQAGILSHVTPGGLASLLCVGFRVCEMIDNPSPGGGSTGPALCGARSDPGYSESWGWRDWSPPSEDSELPGERFRFFPVIFPEASLVTFTASTYRLGSYLTSYLNLPWI